MKKATVFFLAIILFAESYHAQGLEPQDCLNITLKDVSNSYWAKRAFSTYYSGFLELDGGNSPSLAFGLEELFNSYQTGPTIQKMFVNDYDPNINVGPVDQSLRTGLKDCIDIFIESNPTPLYRLTHSEFKTGDSTTFTLAGHRILPTNFSEKFQLNDILNDQINHVFFSPSEKKLFRLGLVGDEYQDKGVSIIFIPMAVYDRTFAELLIQGKISTEIEKGLLSPELQKKIDKINEAQRIVDSIEMDQTKREEIQQTLNQLKDETKNLSMQEQQARINSLLAQIEPTSKVTGKVKITLTQFVQAIKTKFAGVSEVPYKNLVSNPIEGLRSGMQVYKSDASGNMVGDPLNVTVDAEGEDILVISPLKEGETYAFVISFVDPFPTEHPPITAAFKVKKVE
ncbi:MAG: cell division protein ZapB [archaeon]